MFCQFPLLPVFVSLCECSWLRLRSSVCLLACFLVCLLSGLLPRFPFANRLLVSSSACLLVCVFVCFPFLFVCLCVSYVVLSKNLTSASCPCFVSFVVSVFLLIRSCACSFDCLFLRLPFCLHLCSRGFLQCVVCFACTRFVCVLETLNLCLFLFC